MHAALHRTGFVSVLLVTALASPSCASDKDAVAVSGSIGNASVVVEDEVLVTMLSGGFDVSIELGARASEHTNVTFSEFSLVRASDGVPVLEREHLSVVTDTTMPVRLDPGSHKTVGFRVGNRDQPGAEVEPMETDKDDFARVCAEGPLRLVATFQDSANGQRSQPLRSGELEPGGCP